MARNNNNFIHKKTLITANSVSPDAIFNTDDLIAGQGGLTTGGILSIAVGNGQTFLNYGDDDARGALDYSGFTVQPSPANNFSEPADPSINAEPVGILANAYTGSTYVFKNNSGGYDLTIPGPVGPGTPSYQGSIPFVSTGDIRVNLNTGPTANQDLINFFGASAGADSDQIHTYEIYDEVPSNEPGSVTLKDDNGVDLNVKLVSTATFGSPLIPYADNLNTIDLDDSNPSTGRHFIGTKGFTFATGTPEFVYDPVNFTSSKDKNSRFRFRTRKSTPEEITGGATPTYGLDAPEIPLGQGVSIPVFSNLSPKFVFKVRHKLHSQGSIKGYSLGGSVPDVPVGGAKRVYSFVTNGLAVDVPSIYTLDASNGAGSASETHGYQSGGNIPNDLGLPSDGRTRTVSKFPFASDASSEANVGTLTQNKERSRGVSSEVAGYNTGGRDGNRSIDKFPFSTDNNVSSVGNSFGPGVGPIPLIGDFRPADGVENHQTASGPTKGYMAGGSDVSTLQHFPYATDAPGTTITDITGFTAPATTNPSNFSLFNPTARTPFQFGTGHNSVIAGYVSGAENTTELDKFPWATEVISTNVASVGPATTAGGGTSSFSSGFIMSDGGNPLPREFRYSLRRFPFATDQPSTSLYEIGSGNNNQRSNVQV